MNRVYRALAAGLVLAALIGASLVGAQQPDNNKIALSPCVNGDPTAWICYYN